MWVAFAWSCFIVVLVFGWVAFQEIDRRWRQRGFIHGDHTLSRVFLYNDLDQAERVAETLLRYYRPHPVTRRVLPVEKVRAAFIVDHLEFGLAGRLEPDGQDRGKQVLGALNTSVVAVVARTRWADDVKIAVILAGLSAPEILAYRDNRSIPNLEALRVIAALGGRLRPQHEGLLAA